MKDQKTFEDAKGDGGSVENLRGAPTLQELKGEIQAIVSDADKGLAAANIDALSIRRCEWSDQWPDARKHAGNNEEVPEPFDGATDGRYRIADMVINEDVMLYIIALMRSQVQVLPREPSDASRAANMTLVLRYVLDTMGWEWLRENIKLAQYLCGDSPAVGLMSVYWKQERHIELRTLAAEDILKLYVDSIVDAYGDGPDGAELIEQATDAAMTFLSDLFDSEIPDEAFVDTVKLFFPELADSRAKKVVSQLRKYETASFPVPVEKVAMPWVCAKRYLQDFWLATNTQDFQRARVWFESELLSRAEVHERATLYGWRKEFVDAVLEHEAEVAFPEYKGIRDNRVERYDAEHYRGLYQIIHANFRAVNEDGVMGRYRLTMHHEVDVDANGIQLIDNPHGKYSGHFFQREVLSNRILDSRGLAELAGPHQSLIKLFGDSAGDNGQLSGVPPVITRGRRNQGELYIAPLVELQAKRDGDYKWMNPPQYPQTVFELLKRLQAEIDEYSGRDTENVSAALAALHKQFKALWWLSNVSEVYRQILSLCQAYMPADILGRITNADGDQLIQSREDIAGEFDIKLLFDPMDLDPAYIEKLGSFVRDILTALDRDKRINMGPVVESLFYRIAPDLAERALKTQTRADQDELQSEMKDYMKILGGIEPERVTDGSINYPLRAQFYRDIQAANPAAFAALSPDRQSILTAHVQYLEAMATQYGENVQIGQEGARRALAEETEAASV